MYAFGGVTPAATQEPSQARHQLRCPDYILWSLKCLGTELTFFTAKGLVATGGATECWPSLHTAIPALHLLGVVVHIYNPSTQELGTGGSGVPLWVWGGDFMGKVRLPLKAQSPSNVLEKSCALWHLPVTLKMGGNRIPGACWPDWNSEF